MSDKTSDQNQAPENPSSNGPASGQNAEGESHKVIEDLKSQVEKYKNEFLYLRAEFDNYRRNMIKERSDLVKYGGEKIIIDILGVLDNFERALESKPNPENLSNFVKGIEMTQSELKSALSRHGVTEVPSQGVAFDPSLHEALSSEESRETAAGHITRVFKKPYKLHDKVIRTGQVVVAREPAN